MTVAELIWSLQECPQDRTVMIDDGGDRCRDITIIDEIDVDWDGYKSVNRQTVLTLWGL